MNGEDITCSRTTDVEGAVTKPDTVGPETWDDMKSEEMLVRMLLF